MKNSITICFVMSIILSSLTSLSNAATIRVNGSKIETTTALPNNDGTNGTNIWYNGEWWPLYIPEWWAPTASRHPFDPHSFVHCQTGIMFFYFCGYPLLWFFRRRKRRNVTTSSQKVLIENKDNDDMYPNLKCWPLWIGFAIVLIGSLIFEIVENSEGMIKSFREHHGTSADYDGDSFQNIIGDLISVQTGYVISWLFLYLSVPWMSVVWFLVVDVCLILYMRDDGIFLFFNVFLKNQAVIDWQAEGVTLAKYQQMNNVSLLNPPSAFLSLNDTMTIY